MPECATGSKTWLRSSEGHVPVTPAPPADDPKLFAKEAHRIVCITAASILGSLWIRAQRSRAVHLPAVRSETSAWFGALPSAAQFSKAFTLLYTFALRRRAVVHSRNDEQPH